MTILNHDYIKNSITKNNGKEDVKYRWSHGATDKHLGDGMLIYSLIYYHKFQTCVCLGSGGGFIPRIMTQAKMDLTKEGFGNRLSFLTQNSLERTKELGTDNIFFCDLI